MKLSGIVSFLLALTVAFAPIASAQESTALPEVSVEESRVAIEEYGNSFSMPVTALRYEPLVDLQQRNTAEAQSDIVIRGGTFETSGVRLGTSALSDPQTGHYNAEIPLDPYMLEQVQVLTGLENALKGFAANTGTVQYDFRNIKRDAYNLRVGAGDFGSSLVGAYGAFTGAKDGESTGVRGDVSYGYSESEGPLANADSRFQRFSGRLQFGAEDSLTNVYAGYQQKNFQWPYLYALRELHNLVGSSGIEGEDLSSMLIGVQHKEVIGKSHEVNVSSFVRRQTDDYEFDVQKPGLFNAFEHDTNIFGLGAEGRHDFANDSRNADGVQLNWTANVNGDDLDSTALTFGDYRSRTQYRLAVLPGYKIAVSEDTTLLMQAGGVYDAASHDQSHVSPLGGVSLKHAERETSFERVFFEISQSSQLPSYTALNSNPTSGLFRGNKNLVRAVSTTYELGTEVQRSQTRVKAGVFVRDDLNLADWTYTRVTTAPFASRTAANVDLTTYGAEAVAQQQFGWLDLTGGYTWLEKDSDYGELPVDASFYALNFPRQRVTASAVLRPCDWFSLRSDNEYRLQEPNQLRTSPDTTYLISSLSANFEVPGLKGATLSGVVENVGNEHFEEVPGVPGAGRIASVILRYAM